jgi:hypothetical protein
MLLKDNTDREMNLKTRLDIGIFYYPNICCCRCSHAVKKREGVWSRNRQKREKKKPEREREREKEGG